MAERKDQSKGAAHASTDDVNASLLQEAMADFLKSKMVRIQGADHFMQILSTGVFNETKPFFPKEDLSYSDVSDYDDDDDDDDEDDYFQQQKAAHQPKEPHSQTAKITDKKDDKDEMKAEEEQSKEKKQKNKRKKMRRKEKKQSEKENTVILPEEEPSKSDSSEIQEENPSDNNTEANKSPERDKALNETEAAGDEERSVVNNREENLATINKKEEVEQEEEKELDSNNSYAVKSSPEETCNQKPSQEIQENQLVEVLQPEEEKPKAVEEEPKIVEDPEAQRERRHEPNEEKPTATAAEEYANISRDLAGKGNRLAASGMFEHAIECFTDAIKFNPREYRLFGNRSLCYERMQHFENALRDADLSLSMEPNWIKGLFRKGKALCGLKRYYEASLVYEEVLQLDRSSAEAKTELKRAQTLHLMEMGFCWAKCNEALKNHATLQEATEALFAAHDTFQGAGASRDDADKRVLQAEDGQESKAFPPASPSRAQPVKGPSLTSSPLQSRSQSHSPTPRPRNHVKPQLYSIWVGALAPTVTYASLHELFSRVGVIYSIKIMLEHECAFVNYTRMEECERAIQCFDGMVLEGIVLHVRYSFKGQSSLGKKECFFWRTTGCTRQDCTFKHVPEHKNIDIKKFTSRLGFNNM